MVPVADLGMRVESLTDLISSLLAKQQILRQIFKMLEALTRTSMQGEQ